MNSLLLDALRSQLTSRPPVWLMRQAGRYMASYRKIRAQYDFLTICKTPELISRVTQLPLTEFNFDAAIIFSDILMVLEAMGSSVEFVEGIGPVVSRIQSASDIDALHYKRVSERMPYLTEAIVELKKTLHVPLLGFAGAPFTLACYLIEGQSSKEFSKTKKWMLKDKVSFCKLLDYLTEAVCDLIDAQIAAGVDAIQIFDSWAHILSWDHFHEFSQAYIQKILKRITTCPVIVFCKGSSGTAESLATLKPACISLDWQCNMAQMRKKIPESIALQGNLDPEILTTTPEIVKEHTMRHLHSMQGAKGFIFNLGHGILPTTPEENVKALVDCVHSIRSV